jgi:hypothetical protein
MVEQNMKRKVKVWEVIVLLEFITIIFLGLYMNYQRAALIAQASYTANIEKILVVKDKREKDLSAKLSSAMILIQSAADELNQDKQGTAINNVVPPAEPPAVPVAAPKAEPSASK